MTPVRQLFNAGYQRFIHLAHVFGNKDAFVHARASSTTVLRVGPEANTFRVRAMSAKKNGEPVAVQPASHDLNALVPKGAKVLLMFSPARCFVFEKRLPKELEEKRDEIVAQETRVLLPGFQYESVSFDRTTKLENGAILAARATLRKVELEELVGRIALLGASVVGAGVEAEDGIADYSMVTAKGEDYADFHNKRARRSAILALSFLIAVLVGTTALFMSWANAGKNSLVQRIASTEPLAAESRARMTAHAELSRKAEQLALWRKTSPNVAEVIEELSVLLPDAVWVQRLAISGSDLHIEGVGNNLEALIETLESSSSFRNVSFASPIVQLPQAGRHQFAVKMVLEARP